MSHNLARQYLTDYVFLPGLGKEEGEFGHLTEDIKNSLLELKWVSGEPLINFHQTDEKKAFSYEIINLYISMWSEKAFSDKKEDIGYNYLKEKLKNLPYSQKNVKNIIFDSDKYKEERKRNHEDVIRQKESIEIGEEGLYVCTNPQCQSRRTRFVQKQTSSGDEITNVFVTCFACGNHFKGK